jgi:lysophospholipase L1-like esterase
VAVERAPDRSWVFAGLLLAAGVGVVSLVRRGPKVTPGSSRVLLIGDSLAQGLSPPLTALARESRIGMTTLAQQGSTIGAWTRGALNPGLRAKLAEKPTLVLISLGTNDEYLAPTQLPQVAADAKALLALLDPIPVVWILPPTLPKSIGVTPLLRDLAPHAFDSFAYKIPRAADGIHPTPTGYSGWAGTLWKSLK